MGSKGKVKQYKGRGLGWSIIEKLCETGSKFAPFDRAVRKEKSFIYTQEKDK